MAATFSGKLLGQARPPTNVAVSIFSPGSDEVGHVKGIIVSNTTDSPVTYRILFDNDGTDVTEAESLFWDIPIKANASHPIPFEGFGVSMDNPAGNLSVQSSVGLALTFSVFGAIET